MIAPEPIFQPRGTPMSVVGRLKALSEMGHRVDLLTYSLGADVDLPGLRIRRIPRIPGIRTVKIGPSFKKIPLDLCLMTKSLITVMREPVDLIHTHEEAGFWGTALSKLFRIPHVYDMHSSLPQQLKNFNFSKSRVLLALFQALERWVLRSSSAVITICPDLNNHVNGLYPEKDSVLIENVVDYGMIFGESDRSKQIKASLALDQNKVALYTGTFEPYQGLDLLIESARIVRESNENIVFLLVGGHPNQVAQYQARVEKHGLEHAVIFTGQVLPQEVNSYIRCADVLLSPRISGTNTPLKIYAYLRSGVPVVATRLWTHTQVLDDDVAVLTDAEPGAFARGILSAISDAPLAARLTRNARALSEEKYGYARYREKLERIIELAMERGV